MYDDCSLCKAALAKRDARIKELEAIVEKTSSSDEGPQDIRSSKITLVSGLPFKTVKLMSYDVFKLDTGHIFKRVFIFCDMDPEELRKRLIKEDDFPEDIVVKKTPDVF
jgi:hypothetical protein